VSPSHSCATHIDAALISVCFGQEPAVSLHPVLCTVALNHTSSKTHGYTMLVFSPVPNYTTAMPVSESQNCEQRCYVSQLVV